MIKYFIATAALKLFSVSAQTKEIYRVVGNMMAERRLTQRRLIPASLMLQRLGKYVENGDNLLEIGTGWVHRVSIFIRLFYDVDITLFDVCDNRQLETLKRQFVQLGKRIDKEMRVDPRQHGRVESLLKAIPRVRSFDELYRLLGMHYVLEPKGTLHHFPNNSFDAIFSTNVLEHVPERVLPNYIRDLYRLLKPGGHSIHKIDLTDHLYYYDRSVSTKNYLRYSDEVWKGHFENAVQYFNRVQRPEWLQLFHEAGLRLVEEESVRRDIGGIAIAEKWKNLDRHDLECAGLLVVHKK